MGYLFSDAKFEVGDLLDDFVHLGADLVVRFFRSGHDVCQLVVELSVGLSCFSPDAR